MVITVSNLKGGVAKTVTVANLACCLADQRKSVLVVDTDTQCNLTQYLSAFDKNRPTIYDILLADAEIDEVIRPTDFGLDILPCNYNQLAAEIGIYDRYGSDWAGIMENMLEPVRPVYDYILIDCPPALGMISLNAILASDHVILPFMADAFGADALLRIYDVLSNVGKEYGMGIENTSILFTLYTRTRVFDDMIESISELAQGHCFETKIRRSADVPTSTLKRTPVVRWRPRSKVSLDYMDLAKEVMRLGCKKERG